MRRVIISPYSRVLRNGKRNPKNFPYWSSVVHGLIYHGCYVIQIGTIGEEPIGANDFFVAQKLNQIVSMAKECRVWTSIDNFFPHLMNTINKPGVAIYGQSDPRLFGYPYNINLLKSISYLRPDQFGIWEQAEYNEDAFVSADEVITAIIGMMEGVNG